MIETPLISICIPAYKNVAYLRRLLHSIAMQTFNDFEVIITDDSNDNSVNNFINTLKWNFLVYYFKNERILGSPQNWNAATSHAKGKWIKIMHHDDWFSSENSLATFVKEIRMYSGRNFFFCAYENIYENGRKKKIAPPAKMIRQLIFRNPAALLSGNIIGPPSTTIYRNKNILYDKNLKWIVDLDFYIRYLKNTEPCFINESLINVGIHEEQVTKYSFLKPEIEIPEHLIVLNKSGGKSLYNIMVYDAFWRLIRNLKITSVEQLEEYSNGNIIPVKLRRIINHQRKIPSSLLRFGIFSKIAMSFSYFFSFSV